jgi:hypothetical protein
MTRLSKLIGIYFFTIGLVGCMQFDEYYVYDKKNIVSEQEKKFIDKDINARDAIKVIHESTRFRIKISNSPKSSLTVIQSYEDSHQLKEKLKKIGVIINLESESKTYDSCEFINNLNWTCKNFGGYGAEFEMKNGILYKQSQKLIKKYSTHF